jgi:hypothetical protein
MKVIAFEEHYKLPAIAQANKDHPIEQVYDAWEKNRVDSPVTHRRACHRYL